MIAEKLESLRKSEAFLNTFNTAMSSIHQYGIFDILRTIGIVRVIPPNTPNYVDAQAAAANFSIGYNACLDDLMDFVNTYLYPRGENKELIASQKPDFGAVAKLLALGDITEEEAKKLRK